MNLKDEILKSLGPNNTHKEHITEIIEKSSGLDNEGVLRDILFAIKELNLQKKESDFKPILIDDNE